MTSPRDPNEKAFHAFVRDHHPTLVAIARRKARYLRVDPDDVLSGGLERAWRAWSDVLAGRPDDEARLAWCSVTMWNIARERRRLRSWSELPTEDLDLDVETEPDPATRACFRLLLAEVGEILETLDELDQKILVLALEGFATVDIALEVGRSRQRVCHRLAQARERLRTELRRRGFDVPPDDEKGMT